MNVDIPVIFVCAETSIVLDEASNLRFPAEVLIVVLSTTPIWTSLTVELPSTVWLPVTSDVPKIRWAASVTTSLFWESRIKGPLSE